MSTLTTCSFCGKTNNEVVMIIDAVKGVAICDECVEICATTIETEKIKKIVRMYMNETQEKEPK